MCMTIKYPAKRIKRLPKEFTAYKVVDKRDDCYYPPIMDRLSAIEKHNVARTPNKVEHTLGGIYRPYYHSFRTRAACDAVSVAEAVAERDDYTYIKIRIKRKDVTCVGGYGAKGKTQYLTIISKEYSTDFEEYVPQGRSGK